MAAGIVGHAWWAYMDLVDHTTTTLLEPLNGPWTLSGHGDHDERPGKRPEVAGRATCAHETCNERHYQSKNVSRGNYPGTVTTRITQTTERAATHTIADTTPLTMKPEGHRPRNQTPKPTPIPRSTFERPNFVKITETQLELF